MSRGSKYAGPLFMCATCGAQQPYFAIGAYDASGRYFCLRRDLVGGLCFKERAKVEGPAGQQALPLGGAS